MNRRGFLRFLPFLGVGAVGAAAVATAPRKTKLLRDRVRDGATAELSMTAQAWEPIPAGRCIVDLGTKALRPYELPLADTEMVAWSDRDWEFGNTALVILNAKELA